MKYFFVVGAILIFGCSRKLFNGGIHSNERKAIRYEVKNHFKSLSGGCDRIKKFENVERTNDTTIIVKVSNNCSGYEIFYFSNEIKIQKLIHELPLIK